MPDAIEFQSPMAGNGAGFSVWYSPSNRSHMSARGHACGHFASRPPSAVIGLNGRLYLPTPQALANTLTSAVD